MNVSRKLHRFFSKLEKGSSNKSVGKKYPLGLLMFQQMIYRSCFKSHFNANLAPDFAVFGGNPFTKIHLSVEIEVTSRCSNQTK